MLHFCPACQRSFEEAGFCPYDRTQLMIPSSAAGKQTQLSAVHEAQPDEETAHPTHVEVRRETFPLTPAVTNEITAARGRLAVPEQAKIRSVSASDSATDALQTFKSTRANEYDKLVGQTLDGRYFVEKKIGEGGMGVVFSARHAVIERPLAIKVLKREVMRDTATIRRFVQEAKAASRIGHPNIVDVTDFGTTPDGMTYSVMEFIAGQTLGAALRAAAPFPAQRAIKIAVQIARALGAAHDKGIVHRDLKPENVFLLDRDGRTDFVKIVDFGIAKVAPIEGASAEPRLTRAGSVFGTPEYMAPEQAAGRGDTDSRVDIYALGVLLYEMTCGKVPHRADSVVRTIAMQMLDPVEPPTKVRPDLHIPAQLEAVILHALAKKRENRYQTMAELIAALEKVLTVVGQSVTGSPIYALAALPPDADAGIALPLAPTISPGLASAPRSKSPTNRRLKNEPEFTAATDNKPHTFEHVFTEPGVPAQRRIWPLVLLFVVIAAGATTAIVLVMHKRNPVTEIRDAAVVMVPVDAAQDAPDAMDSIDAPIVIDARTHPPIDAADIVIEVDAGSHRRRDAGVIDARAPVITPNGRGTIMVQVMTKPEGAMLLQGTSYRGRGGATLEEPYGTRMEIRCSQKGYKDGHVTIVFDGNNDFALCELKRIKICIEGIKNVFDDCEPAPKTP